MIRLDGSEIHNSRISGMRNGIRLNNNSELSKSVVHDIRGQALELQSNSILMKYILRYWIRLRKYRN